MFGKLFLTSFLAIVAVAQDATTLKINTPPGVTVCRPTLVQWSGGQGPYYVDVIPGDGDGGSAAALQTLVNGEDKTQLTWTVNIAAGTKINFRVKDSTGAQNFASPVSIAAGDAACLNAASGSGSSSGSDAATTSSGGAGGAGGVGGATGASTTESGSMTESSGAGSSTGASSTGGGAATGGSSSGSAPTTTTGSSASASNSGNAASSVSSKSASGSTAATTSAKSGAGALSVAAFVPLVATAFAAYFF